MEEEHVLKQALIVKNGYYFFSYLRRYIARVNYLARQYLLLK